MKSLDNSLPIIFRKLEPTDKRAVSFIIDSWTRSLWPLFQYIPNFKELQHVRIFNILLHSDILLICDKDDTDVIFGYAVWEHDVIHWVYVKHHFRKQGLCKQLLLQIPVSAKFMHSHETRHGKRFIIDKINSRYNPFFLERYNT